MPEAARFPGTRIVPALVVAALASAGSAATTSELDWARVSDVGVVEILTNDEDGDLRETKVWFVLIDGTAYLRTNKSRWLENIRRDPGIRIRIDGAEYVQLARDVSSPEMIERVDEASRAKYGWQEAFIHVFRMRDPQILRLAPPD
jgi:hypothetical protein